MKKIRLKVFESNSSMMHTLILCSDEEWEKWKDGELMYDDWNEGLIASEEVTKEEIVLGEDDDDYERHCYSFDDFFDGRLSEDYYMFGQEYTTESGEKIHAFGYYGHD